MYRVVETIPILWPRSATINKVNTCSIIHLAVKAPVTHRRIHPTHPGELSKFVNYGKF